MSKWVSDSFSCVLSLSLTSLLFSRERQGKNGSQWEGGGEELGGVEGGEAVIRIYRVRKMCFNKKEIVTRVSLFNGSFIFYFMYMSIPTHWYVHQVHANGSQQSVPGVLELQSDLGVGVGK